VRENRTHGSRWRREETRPVGYAMRPRRPLADPTRWGDSVAAYGEISMAAVFQGRGRATCREANRRLQERKGVPAGSNDEEPRVIGGAESEIGVYHSPKQTMRPLSSRQRALTRLRQATGGAAV
jgi:hypothetical protein